MSNNKPQETDVKASKPSGKKARKRFNILVKAEKIAEYVFFITNKMPKKCRSDIIQTLRNEATSLMEMIVRANSVQIDEKHLVLTQRRKYQEEAIIHTKLINNYATICVKMNYITNKQEEYLTTLTYEMYNMLNNWIDSDLARVEMLKDEIWKNRKKNKT